METVVEEVATSSADYTTYLDQLHMDSLAQLNVQYALIILLAAFFFYLVFFGGRYK